MAAQDYIAPLTGDLLWICFHYRLRFTFPLGSSVFFIIIIITIPGQFIKRHKWFGPHQRHFTMCDDGLRAGSKAELIINATEGSYLYPTPHMRYYPPTNCQYQFADREQMDSFVS